MTSTLFMTLAMPDFVYKFCSRGVNVVEARRLRICAPVDITGAASAAICLDRSSSAAMTSTTSVGWIAGCFAVQKLIYCRHFLREILAPFPHYKSAAS
jgi:hypothetical protein